MTTWTSRQIAQARGLRAEAHIDPLLLARARVDVLEATRAKLARALIRHAHPFAIEIHPGDLRFTEVAGEQEWGPISVRCWWEPPTRELELRGGHRDGEVLEFAGAPHDPLMVPRPPPAATLLAQRGDDPLELAPLGIRYECAGWNEAARHWVYETRGR